MTIQAKSNQRATRTAYDAIKQSGGSCTSDYARPTKKQLKPKGYGDGHTPKARPTNSKLSILTSAEKIAAAIALHPEVALLFTPQELKKLKIVLE